VALSFLGVLAWGGALAVGAWMRLLDIRRHLVIDTARRGERMELARELHDVVAHHVAGIVVQAQAARIVAAKRPETLEETLAGIELAGNDALAAMRRVVSLLRDPGDPGDAGGVTPSPEQLSDLVSRFAGHGPAVQLQLPGSGRPSWPPEVTATVYRIVQEALTNVVLHAPDAASVTVTVEEDPSGVTVEVTDDAPRRALSGSPLFAPGGGHGLTGMRERAEALGGTLSAGPGPDGGWTVAAKLPLPARRNA
jgi:signal transduction histidine kinase